MTEAVLDREDLANFTIVRPEPEVIQGSALGRRADIALGGLETGNTILTIGPDILSTQQRQRLDRQGITILDESDITEDFDRITEI